MHGFVLSPIKKLKTKVKKKKKTKENERKNIEKDNKLKKLSWNWLKY